MFKVLMSAEFKYLACFCLIAILACSGVTHAGSLIDPRQIDVKSGHPILFANKESVAKARAKTKALKKFVNKVRRQYIKTDRRDIPFITQQVSKRTKAGQHEESYVNHIGIPLGLYSLLTEDPIGIEYCRQVISSFIEMGVGWNGPGDGHSTGKLFVLGLFYDWIYEYLSTDTRRRIREHILDSIDFLDTYKHGRLLLNPSIYTGSHAHYAHIYALVSLLAIRHDIEQDSDGRQEQYFRLFGKIVNNWISGFNPVAAWTNKGGGHHMGWTYSQAYTRFLPYLAWESATNEESWFTDWQIERTYYYLYAIRQLKPSQYSMYPVIGDSNSPEWNPMRSGLEVAIAASLFEDPYAAWLTDKLGASDFARLLYMPDEWPKIATPDTLPMSRHFPNSGYVVMRDSWDFARNTLMIFKSSSFYSFSHHHRDENAFTIFYKGPLAIDSGLYRAGRGYGSEHWYNYYTRSIAHNTILVYDPKEEFRGRRGAVISNDGGQKMFKNFNPSLKQMAEGGEYHLDGIVKYEDHDDYTFSVGDATKAYAASKLSRFRRSVVYLRNYSYDHPLILVYDRVVSTKPDFKKTYLLHSINEPRVEDNTVEISIKAMPTGGLYQETILPINPRIQVIGGRANKREFYVWDNGYGEPYNFGVDVPSSRELPKHIQRSLLEAGEWRVEISPSVPARDDTFLHAISVVDSLSTTTPSSVTYLNATGIDGLLIRDADGKEKSLVLFYRDPDVLQTDIALPEAAEFDRILIVGLPPETAFSIAESGSVLKVRNDPGGSFASSAAGTLYTLRPEIRARAAANPLETVANQIAQPDAATIN